MQNKISESCEFIKSKVDSFPKTAIVLGSGLGPFVDTVENKTVIPYSEIPNFMECGVAGHSGQLVAGTIAGTPVALMQGRFHVYEGHKQEDVVLPVRVLGTLGAEKIILTNASGGISENFVAGDIVMITDHINLSGRNPLEGPNQESLGPRFPDMSYAYHPDLQEILKTAAKATGYNLKSGVYAGVLGPTYETPAEVRMLGILGADMVGMSTVPECIAANHMGLKVAGLSCITNMAAGIEKGRLNHDDIKDQANQVMKTFSDLLTETIKLIGK